MDKIKSIITDAHATALPLLLSYEETVTTDITIDKSMTGQDQHHTMHAKTTEITLQYLLKVDGVTLEGNDNVRQERRRAVKLLQRWIDRADHVRHHGKLLEEQDTVISK